MTAKIGNRIRYHRIVLNMTQFDLAGGIVSVSYLSKIENGSVEPPKEIIERLCEKLNIDPYLKESTETFEVYTSWFETLFYNDLEQAKNDYQYIKDNKNLIANNELLNIVELHILKYFLLQNKMNEANRQYEKLNKLSNYFNSKENYYWLKFSGYYNFTKLYYKAALDCFQKAKAYLDSAFYLENEEEYGLYYMIALSASLSRNSYLCLNYASKALKFYQDNYHLKQAAQCHILLGITFVRIKEYEEAIESYQLAEMIAEDINDTSTLATSVQNIGHLYSMIDHSQESISYYLKSYHLQIDSEQTKQIVPIASLMKEYYKEKDIVNANYWLDKGLEVIAQDDSQSVYHYEFQVYQQLIKGINHNLENIIVNQIIPFLNEKELHYEKISFYKILADDYYSKKKYKSAAVYNKEALKLKLEVFV